MEENKESKYKEGKIILFTNTKKEGKQPDHTGWGMYKGEKFEVSMWNNISQAGNSYKSGDVKAPYVPPTQPESNDAPKSKSSEDIF
tara:strand:- start:23461 stop:23718 length:258 start_codon:yes stop_codon:yes gene_type:complete